MAVMKLRKSIEIDIERLAQIGRRVERLQVDLGRDIAEFLPHHSANIRSRS